MSSTTIVIHGESYISVTAVAECYDVSPAWVEESCALGLLGRVERVERTKLVATAMLERVARIRRLQLEQDVELRVVATLIAVSEP